MRIWGPYYNVAMPDLKRKRLLYFCRQTTRASGGANADQEILDWFEDNGIKIQENNLENEKYEKSFYINEAMLALLILQLSQYEPFICSGKFQRELWNQDAEHLTT